MIRKTPAASGNKNAPVASNGAKQTPSETLRVCSGQACPSSLHYAVINPAPRRGGVNRRRLNEFVLRIAYCVYRMLYCDVSRDRPDVRKALTRFTYELFSCD